MGLIQKLGIMYYAGLAVALGLMIYQYRLIHDRDRGRCFKAFLHNNWVGATIFTGIALDYLIGNLLMKYKDLRDFIAQLENQGELKRIRAEIDPHLEMTEICDRVLKAGGPAFCLKNPEVILFPCWEICSVRRGGWRWAWGRIRWKHCAKWETSGLPEGTRSPQRLEGCVGEIARAEAGAQHGAEGTFARPLPGYRMGRKDVDLGRLPIQTCWPGDAGPLITWGLTVTRGPHKTRQNLGIYRQQVIAPNKVIMRWLPIGAAHWIFAICLDKPGQPYPHGSCAGGGPRHRYSAR